MGCEGSRFGAAARLAGVVGGATALWVATALWSPSPARAAPGAIPYRGELSTTGGSPFEGTVEVKAGLYASATGGTAVWGPATWPSVTVKGGDLQVVLGDPPSPALDGSELPPEGLWLDLGVDGVKLDPRQRVLSTAYSLRAGDAERLGGEEASAYVTQETVDVLVSEVAPVCWSGSYADLVDTPSPPDLSEFVQVPDMQAVAAKIWCLEECDAAKMGDCRKVACDGASKSCVDAGAQPDGALCKGGAGVCSGGECCTGLRCGATCCPAVSGYSATCNPQHRCEYVRTTLTPPWHGWDVWIYVPPGSFAMGCPGGGEVCNGSEQPVHVVTFATGYLISKYEVVVAQYEACQSAAGTCTPPSVADWDGAGWGTNTSANGRGGHPQNGLTWQQAKDFCAWVAPGGRLPSEAEWEFAATGETHRTCPWGNAPGPTCGNGTAVMNELGTTAGYGCGTGGTWAAGSKPAGASARGALDMAGNVWEWVEDCWHDTYSGAPTNGTAWTASCSGTGRADRGGSFDTNAGATIMRVARRLQSDPDIHSAYQGARCLRPFP